MSDNTLSKNVKRVFAIGNKNEEALKEYKETINRIDDWFEYMNESEKDREFIHKELDRLTEKLKIIYSSQRNSSYDPFGYDPYGDESEETKE